MTKQQKQPPEPLTDAFFDEAFRGYTMPSGIRLAAVKLCRAYQISGTSDPGYIANTIAHALGLGDGCGLFEDDRKGLVVWAKAEPDEDALPVPEGYGHAWLHRQRKIEPGADIDKLNSGWPVPIEIARGYARAHDHDFCERLPNGHYRK